MLMGLMVLDVMGNGGEQVRQNVDVVVIVNVVNVVGVEVAVILILGCRIGPRLGGEGCFCCWVFVLSILS